MNLTPEAVAALASNPWALIIVIIFGAGGWKAVLALRKDWNRDRRMESVEVTEAVQHLAAGEIARLEKRLCDIEARMNRVLRELDEARREADANRRRASAAEAQALELIRHVQRLEEWVATHIPDLSGMPRLPAWLATPPAPPAPLITENPRPAGGSSTSTTT